MSIAYTKLLRRTLATLGAGIILAASHPALSQGTVTLSGATGNSCSYSQMTVQPNGSISVTCVTSTPTAATFSLSAPASLAVSTTSTFSVSRSGGPVDSLTVNWSVSGGSCTANTGSLTFAQGGAPQAVGITTNAIVGSCVVSITAPSGHQVAPGSATITVGSSAPPPPPPPPTGCPAPPSDYKYQTMDKWRSLTPNQVATEWNSVDQLRMTSGQIATYDAINVPNPASSAVVVLTQGQQPATPQPVLTEMSVSKCPGVIDTSVAACYMRGTFINNNQSPRLYRRPVQVTSTLVWDSQAKLGYRGCWAPESEKWYVNVRWTFASCPYGVGQCGFSMQWSQSSNW